MQASEPRIIDGFAYRTTGDGAAGLTIIALHGSGADEMTMFPLACGIAVHARVISVRGRVDQNGERRWFRKITPTTFDQDSIREQSAAFAVFLQKLCDAEKFDIREALLLGYSNGGNLVHATMLLHPGPIRRAALLRTMPVLRPAPPSGLDEAKALVIRGMDDATYGPFAPNLVRLLRRRGAAATLRTVRADHMFGARDAAAIATWLAAAGAAG